MEVRQFRLRVYIFLRRRSSNITTTVFSSPEASPSSKVKDVSRDVPNAATITSRGPSSSPAGQNVDANYGRMYVDFLAGVSRKALRSAAASTTSGSCVSALSVSFTFPNAEGYVCLSVL